MTNFFLGKTPLSNLSYPELHNTCISCTQCELSKTRHKVVVGEGPVPCTLMIIGEGPGEQEDLQGRPFVGKAGQLLTKILNAADIHRETEVFITNIVKCRPPGNRNPSEAESNACRFFLMQQLQLVKPKVLIVLGSPAIKNILPGEKRTITQLRGTWIKKTVPYMSDLLYVMPMLHPSYLLRNPSSEEGKPKWLTWQDIKEVKAFLTFLKKTTLH